MDKAGLPSSAGRTTNGMEPDFPIVGGWRELYMKSCQNKERKTVLPAPLLIYTIFTLQRLLCFNSAFA